MVEALLLLLLLLWEMVMGLTVEDDADMEKKEGTEERSM